jgi:hypothetical protein
VGGSNATQMYTQNKHRTHNSPEPEASQSPPAQQERRRGGRLEVLKDRPGSCQEARKSETSFSRGRVKDTVSCGYRCERERSPVNW